MNGSLEYYKVFYYVERLGSITRAAQALCISQPAVSQAVRQLEQTLGVTLFIRTAKGVRLTEEGKTLAVYVERGMENFLKGEEAMDRLSQAGAEIYRTDRQGNILVTVHGGD